MYLNFNNSMISIPVTWIYVGSGTSAKFEGQEWLSTKFFQCSAIGIMSMFAKVGGAAASSAPAVPELLWMLVFIMREKLMMFYVM